MEEWRGCISHSLKRKGLDYETRKTGSEIIIKIGMIFQRVKRMKQANILQNFPWNFPKLKNPQNFEEAQMVFEERPPPTPHHRPPAAITINRLLQQKGEYFK